MVTLKRFGMIVASLAIVVSLLLVPDCGLVLAEEGDIDQLHTLSYKVEGTYQGERAEFWQRLKYIGTDKELFRIDITIYETEESMSLILDEDKETAFLKQMGSGMWQEMPMLYSQMWDQYRDGALSSYGSADDWYRWAEDDQNEYLLESEEENEEYTTRVYDIKADEPIEDSVFTPDGS